MSTLPENVSTEEYDISLKISDAKRKRDDLHEPEMNLSSALGERDERSITVEHIPPEMTKENLSEYYAFFGDVKLVTIQNNQKVQTCVYLFCHDRTSETCM